MLNIEFRKSLEIEMELYSKHLMACSSVGPKLTQDLHQAIGDQMVEDETRTRTHQILQSVGFDEVVRFYNKVIGFNEKLIIIQSFTSFSINKFLEGLQR